VNATRLTTHAEIAGTPALLNRRVLRVVSGAGAAAAFPALLGCTSAPTKHPKGSGTSSEAVTATPGTMVMVIRHAEKPAKSGAGGAGISLSGASDVFHSLTERGWTRAADLVALFTPAGARALPTPTVIYASGVGAGDGEGTRPRQTVGPVAAELGIPVDTDFSRGQETALAQHAAAQPGPTLICWQHESIPAIGAAFAPATLIPPTVWPDERYDVVWVFTATDNGWQFEQVPERLLPDDADTAIP